MKPLKFPNKQIRARVIADYLRRCGRFDSGVVCFSCGNASKALAGEGLYVVDISPKGGLSAQKWWSVAEIAKAFPTMFDATSGHLSVALMAEIGQAFRVYIGELDGDVAVKSGSGETAVCLALAYPELSITAEYDDLFPATTWNADAPLNPLVRRLCSVKQLQVSA